MTDVELDEDFDNSQLFYYCSCPPSHSISKNTEFDYLLRVGERNKTIDEQEQDRCTTECDVINDDRELDEGPDRGRGRQ